VTASFLVDSDRVDEVLNRAREYDALHPEAELACSGPWPPFNFAEPSHG